MTHGRRFAGVQVLLLAAVAFLPVARDAAAETPAARADSWQADLDAGRRHWAFQKPAAPTVPEVADAVWPAGDIDRFLLAEMEKAGVKPGNEDFDFPD